jgi:hypothetical protein
MNKLTHVENRIIVSIDHDRKNWHQIEGGPKIRIERRFDNFNERYTKPVNAIVVSSEDISEGTEVIVHHTAIHETNLVNNYKPLSGKDEGSEIKYYSISENEVFAWFNESTESWQPTKGYDFALRIYEAYKGILEGIEPTLIKQALWITTGEYKNKACVVLQASDYQLIFQGRNDTEVNIIRLRSEDRPKEQRESEIVAIHNNYTEKILRGDLIVGLTKSDAKSINEYICQ